ncbi:MAG: twin transmembrane helix small protein [Nitratireductor sp.]|nr:twin transmembrane helix small protein [Nitratireductor sp.]
MLALNILVPLALAAVVIVLGLGLYNLMRGGNPNRSQRLMRLRILFQFIAVVLVVAALYIGGRG